MRLALVSLMLSATLIAGCIGPDLGPDAAELANIRESNIVPKSSATAFVKTFDKFCVSGPQAPATKEALLRDAGYVPLRRVRNGVRSFASDDRRPAVIFSDRLCMVQVRSRAGQTNRVRRYVQDSFPKALAQSTKLNSRSFEELWKVSDRPAAMVGTRRTNDGGNHTKFALIYFRPDS